ncbi:hypothetical protein KMZ29_14620 [Bradyrhizobium sediminis]|uniref:Uncharacterized protein n=1 Tax=Bradyrhizobium sediminis TaxID=2840469 RepID=A0A975NAM8_9BRAD|nr:hypothetical protein [Bradyrhizobium sediminis]QWG11016.1 hypothetical protein KMZ29_14620 [Bradyrhizobium sediminis]
MEPAALLRALFLQALAACVQRNIASRSAPTRSDATDIMIGRIMNNLLLPI